jgi:signal recognition particle GTPase
VLQSERCGIEDDAFKHIEAIIHSMTPIERSKPSTMIKEKRSAKGSGTKNRASESIDETV